MTSSAVSNIKSWNEINGVYLQIELQGHYKCNKHYTVIIIGAMDVAALTVSLAVDDIIDNLTKTKHRISRAQVINSFRLSPFFLYSM